MDCATTNIGAANRHNTSHVSRFFNAHLQGKSGDRRVPVV
jgi:hypothetical protein